MFLINFFTGWADYYSHLIFNKKKLTNENFFNMLTMESKFKIECIMKGLIMKNCKATNLSEDNTKETFKSSLNQILDNIKEEKTSKENVLTYNLWNLKFDSKGHESSEDLVKELIRNYLNESRTLTSRFDVVIVKNQEKILIETRLSRRRDFHYDMLFFQNFR